MLSNRFADNVLIAILTLLVLLPFFIGYRQRRSVRSQHAFVEGVE
jgi:hypothetical protein